jgi:hypothetical protein
MIGCQLLRHTHAKRPRVAARRLRPVRPRHSRGLAHPFSFFKLFSPLSVGRYCFVDFISDFFTPHTAMDSIDFLATNSESYWTRFENSTECFEPDSSLACSVRIVDVPASAKPQPSGAVPLKVQECGSLKLLDEHLANPANASYSLRLMQVEISCTKLNSC